MSLKEADRIIKEYEQPNSMNSATHSTIDNGNLFFAATEYQKAYSVIKAECEQLKEENKHLNIYTCYKCSDKKTCQYAYDAYNTNDDCLAIK